MHNTENKRYTMNDFLNIVKQLRDPKDGCPWDIKQTHESLRKNLIEECYEVCEAIDKKDNILLQEELGDVLLQVAMHAEIAEEENAFSLEDVCHTVSEKLVYRHPHIFGNTQANSAKEVYQNWDALKRKSKDHKTVTQSLKDIPKVFPAAMRVEKIQKKCANVGFDYKNTDEAIQILINQAKSLDNEIKKGNNRNSLEVLGNLLFTAIAVGRLLEGDNEKIISNAGTRFIERFEEMEQQLLQQNTHIFEAEPQEMKPYWDKVKFTYEKK